MKKLAIVLVLAVMLPSLVLGWLAVRNLRDQEIVVERQRALLYQGTADGMAGQVRKVMGGLQAHFRALVDRHISAIGPDGLARDFDPIVWREWEAVQVGFATETGGRLLAPLSQADQRTMQFIGENGRFLTNAEAADVYLSMTNDFARPGLVALDTGVAPNIPAEEALERVQQNAARGAFAPRSAPDDAEGAESSPSFVQSESAEQTLRGAASAAQPPSPFPPSDQAATAAQAFPAGAADDSAPQKPEPEMAANARQSPEPSPEPAAANPYSYKKMQSDGLAQVAQRRMQIDRATEEVRELADQEAEAPLQEDASPAREPAEPEGEIRLRSAGEAKKITQAEVPPSKAQAMGRSNGNGSNGGGAAQAAESEPPPTRQLRRTRPAFTPSPGQPESKIASTRAAFLDAVGDNEEGAVARFINGEMQVLLWYRPPPFPDYVFGVELDLEFLAGILADVVKAASEDGSEVCLALLDERGTPVATSVAGFDADWSRPFVAAEIGGALPHWEIAAYLTDPRALGKAASAARIALWLMVLLLIAAIGVGGGLIFFDLRKELALARQKTDFVSNVSHELKTPLTSITMFSDLLCNGAPEPDAQRRYAQVIQSEAGRLARLINNVLDFSRMERGDKRYQFSEIDLGGFLDELLGHYRPHLEAGGYRLRFHNALPAGAAIRADRDALSQVIVNLISNAEKYGGEAKVIDVELGEGAGGAAEIRVCDRGDGVPSGTEEKIFEKFFRAHDSLDSGIQGSGLGLTLARQIALFHGGAIRYGRREGGGSVFTLALPLSGSSPDRAAKAENAPGDPLSRTPPTP